MFTFRELVGRGRGWSRDGGLAFDLARIYLGIGLVVRGGLFVAQPEALVQLSRTHGDWFVPMALGHFVTTAHLIGGALLSLGLATRLAALIQVPVLIGALFVVHGPQGLLTVGQSTELVGLVLTLLVLYSFFGAGRLSLDHYFAGLPSAEPSADVLATAKV